MDRRTPLFLILVLCLVSSCTKPDKQILFLPAEDAIDGVYDFSLDLSDTLSSFDLSFYSACDLPPVGVTQESAVPLNVRWLAPSDTVRLRETVYFKEGKGSAVSQLYRTGVEPKELGIWHILVCVDSMPAGFRGLGIICERKDYGTR